jgi:hypothetical protein
MKIAKFQHTVTLLEENIIELSFNKKQVLIPKEKMKVKYCDEEQIVENLPIVC